MNPSRSTVTRAVCGLAVAALLLAAGAAHAAPEDKAAPSSTTPLDINVATAEELTTLPGIGPALARRIVEFRDEHGPFRRVEDLMRVKGVGEKSFQKLKDRIRVGSGR